MTFEQPKKISGVFKDVTGLREQQKTTFIYARSSNEPPLSPGEALPDADDRATALIEPNTDSDPTLRLEASGDLEIPTASKCIGAYEIVRELGRGGMGAVYEAVRADKQFNKRVAIKVIKRGMDTDFVIQRFRQERQILATLDHPNIARLLDGGTTDDGLPYIVMEYIEGKSITQYCDEKRLTTTERLKLFQQVCSAIHYAHQNLIVHRDIKPGNILVTDQGVPKVLDFGIAKLLAPDFAPDQIDMTAQSVRLMTPAYASPEQAKGEPITTASDTYSLGVLLYQLLTGVRPYELTSASPQEIMRVICEQEPDKPSTAIRRIETTQAGAHETRDFQASNYVSEVRKAQPDKLRRQLAGDLDTIILKALRKEPQRRYASVEQFSEDLRRHLEGLPILARTDSYRYRAGKFVQRHKASVAAATVFILLLMITTGFAIYQAGVARRERDKAEQRFNQVRKLANAVLFDYHDGIARLSGSTPVRERMVKDALEYLDNLSQESSGDPSLLRELASAYQKVGMVQGSPFIASFGDYQGALASQRKALSIREALASANSADVGLGAELAHSYSLIGDLLRVTGQADGMLEHYQKAQKLLEELVAVEPDNLEVRKELAPLYMRVGRALETSANISGALEIFRQSLSLSEELAATDPSDAEMRRDVCLANMYVADALAELGKLEEALQHRRKALALAEALAAQDKTNAQVRRDVGVMLQRLADTQTQAEDFGAALANNRKALLIDQELVAADPNNAQARRDLVADYQKIGKLLLQQGDVAGALVEQRKALTLSEDLAAADPSNTEARSDLSNSFYKIGDVLMAKKDLRGALQHYQKSLAIDESLANDDPTNADARLTVAESYLSVSDIMLKLGDTAGAMQGYTKAQTIYESLASADASEDNHRRNQATVQERLGDAYVALAMKKSAAQAEQWGQAKRLYQQSLAVWIDLQKRNALTPEETGKPEEVSQKAAKSAAALEKVKAK